MVEKNKSTNYFFIDLDGTLLDSISTLYKVYLHFLKVYNIRGTIEEFNRLNGPSLREVVKILRSTYQLPYNESVLYSKYIEIINLNYSNSCPFSDSNYFLETLYKRGFTIFLTTSSSKDLSLPLLKKLKWDRYFTGFIFGDEVMRSKPDPEIYRKAINKAKANTEQIIVIEDSPNGVRSAHEANLKVYAISRDHTSSELLKAGASKVFKSLSLILKENF